MNPRSSFASSLVFCLVLSGCVASLRPLTMSDPPSSVARPENFKKKIPVPVTLVVEAPENLPTIGGKYTYPLKKHLERAFQDAANAMFVSAEGGDYAYRLEVTATSMRLQPPTMMAAAQGQKQAEFYANVLTILRGPDDKVIENKNYEGREITPFDQTTVPEAVWRVCYKAANDFLGDVRKARWLAKAQTEIPAGKGGSMDKAQMSAMIEAATKKAMGDRKPEEAEKPQIESDIDKPGYQLAERENDFAVVVGIEKYSSLVEAPFAERDAETVKRHLVAQGFPVRNVVSLTGNKATKTGLQKYLDEWLPKNVKPESRVFFYFSGHGAPDTATKLAYLVPWDGDANFLESTAYSTKHLYERLGNLKAKEVVVALDACFSGSGGRSVLAKGARPLVLKVETGIADLPGNMTAFSASQETEITSSLDDQGHGIFTYFFVKGLSGAAKNSSGAVTAQSLFDYLSPKVSDAARRQNREQTPVLRGSDPEKVLAVYKK